MKKNTTGSKASLRRLPVEQQTARPQRKPQQATIVRTNPNTPVAIVKCNNCKTMVERELMKLHLNMCLQHRCDARGYIDVEVCKFCRIAVPLNRTEAHQCQRELQREEIEKPRADLNSEYIGHSESQYELPDASRNQRRPEQQLRRDQQRLEVRRAPKRQHGNDNAGIKRPNQREAIIQSMNRPQSRQRELMKRARTNDIQHRLIQRELEQRRRPRGPANRQEQRPLLQSQQQRDHERQKRERQARERQRQRQQHQQQQQQKRRQQQHRARANHNSQATHDQPRNPQPRQNPRNQHQQPNSNRRRRRVAQSSNSRQPRRQYQGFNFMPFDLFNNIQTRFNQLNFNGNSLSQHMEHLSQQLGNVMENFSQMMSPFGNHNRRRVIWYEQDIGSDEGEQFFEEQYYEVGTEDDSYYEDEPEGLDIDEIEEIPVHQYNARRQNPHSDTTSKSCAVCLSDFIHGQTVKLLYCSHKFHQDCIDKWLELKGNCPVCREDLRAG